MKRVFILVSFLLSACTTVQTPAINHGQPTPVTSDSVMAVTLDMQTGSLILHIDGEKKPLGQILKNGQLELAEGVTGSDFALATLIMVKSNSGEGWNQIVGGLPR